MTKSLKKVLSVLLCSALLFGAVPLNGFVGLRLPSLSSLLASVAHAAEPTSGTCGNSLTWDYDTATDTLTISGTGAMNDYSSSQYNYSFVTTAPWKAYYQTMQTVVIKSGVTSIGYYAFEFCESLMNVIIPDSVTSIGNGAFYGCTGLVSVIIPDSVTSMQLCLLWLHLADERDHS